MRFPPSAGPEKIAGHVELNDYIRVLRKSWLLILLFAILGGVTGATVGVVQQPTYESSAKLYVSVRSEGAVTGDLVQGTSFARQIVTSYAEIATTAIVLDPVIADLGLDTTSIELSKSVSATAPPNTVGITITASDADPALAAQIADAVAASLTDIVETILEAPATPDDTGLVRLTTVQPADMPTSPSSPNVSLYLGIGVLLGLAVGVALALLRNVLDTRVHTLHDLEQLMTAPIVGGIAFDPEASKRPLLLHADPRSPRAESFRALRTNLRFLEVHGEPRVFVVSSAGRGEGKSTTTVNLAIALAQSGARVALIDGDLRIPRVADYMGVEGGVGLTDVLIGRVSLVDALQRWGTDELFVLAAGTIPPNPSELLGSQAMDQVLAALSDHFDFVIIDAPPLLLVTDAAVLGTKCRGVLLVAAAGKARKQDLQAAARTVETASATVLGVIGTMLPTKGPDSYTYGTYTDDSIATGDVKTGAVKGHRFRR